MVVSPRSLFFFRDISRGNGQISLGQGIGQRDGKQIDIPGVRTWRRLPEGNQKVDGVGGGVAGCWLGRLRKSRRLLLGEKIMVVVGTPVRTPPGVGFSRGK